MTYDSQYFIDKFSAIPEEKWCIRAIQRFENGIEQRCAMGWCFSKNINPNKISEEDIRSQENLQMDRFFHRINASRVDINNGDDPRYQQPTPKQRVLAAFADIQKLERGQSGMIVKTVTESETKTYLNGELKETKAAPERIVYVTIDQSVRDLQRAELSEQ